MEGREGQGKRKATQREREATEGRREDTEQCVSGNSKGSQEPDSSSLPQPPNEFRNIGCGFLAPKTISVFLLGSGTDRVFCLDFFGAVKFIISQWGLLLVFEVFVNAETSFEGRYE